MDIDVAGQASREEIKLTLVVRLGVALTAVRNLAVLTMTGTTGHLAMLTLGRTPFIKNRIVATATGLYLSIVRECDLQRFVNSLVTLLTGLNRLTVKVAVMTFEAIRDIAVTLMMTGLTPLFRVSARVFLEILSRLAMTIATDLGQVVTGRESKWRMWITVTIQAIRLLRAMRLIVTRRTFWHQLSIVVPERVVGVKPLMTFLAGKTMLAPGLLEISKLTVVTLATLSRLKRYRIGRIETGICDRQRL
jgi:hypothetical protein